VGVTFWASLTEAEQQGLAARGERVNRPAGTVLCREDASAADVMVILRGCAKVCSGDRILAMRGPGDLVGERAALMIRSRSATVVALEAVEVLVVPAAEFARFLDEQPRVAGVLEQELYDRLSERRVSGDVDRAGTGEAEWSGRNCSILYTDIASFNDPVRTDDDRRVVKHVMYDELRSSFDESGVPWQGCHREDRGDGALVVVPPSVPTVALVHPLVSRLATGIRAHNRRATEVVRIQLRVALHVGPVTKDEHGVAGEAVNQTARLLDAPVFKAELAGSGADLGLIVSEFVYDSVVKHAPGGIDPEAYQGVDVEVKETSTKAWIHLNTEGRRNAPALRPVPPAARSGPSFEGDLRVQGDFVLGNKIIIRE
jgi:CRP-like cAMP-binding protein